MESPPCPKKAAFRCPRITVLATLAVAAIACSSEKDDTESADNAVRAADAPMFEAPTAAESSVTVAKHPFVLVHAFNGSATNDWSFNGVKEALEADGHFVYVANIQPYNGTPERAKELGKEIDKARKAFCAKRNPGDAECLARTKSNLIGHSQGGLDARYVIFKEGYGERVATVTTLGAPHHGTPIGDLGLKFLKGGTANAIADALFKLIGMKRSTPELAADTHLRAAIYWLSEERAKHRADDITDDPRVHYESWAGYGSVDGDVSAEKLKSECDGKVFGDASHAAKFLSKTDAHFVPLAPAFGGRLSDGHIPIASAKGPTGTNWTFRGCVPADHLDLIGRPASGTATSSGRTGFSHVPFFRAMAHQLVKRHGG